jgi:hypothetical protein
LGYAGHRQYFKPTFPILTIIGQPHDRPTSLCSGTLLFVSGPAGNPFAAASSARRNKRVDVLGSSALIDTEAHGRL